LGGFAEVILSEKNQKRAIPKWYSSFFVFYPESIIDFLMYLYINPLPSILLQILSAKNLVYKINYFIFAKEWRSLIARQTPKEPTSSNKEKLEELDDVTILRLLEEGKTAAYFAYVRILTSRQTPKEAIRQLRTLN